MDQFQSHILKIYNNQKGNRYSKLSNSPDTVHLFDSNRDKNLSNWHIFRVGEKLIKAGIEIAGITRAGETKVTVSFYSFEQANEFVESSASKVCDSWKAFIPDQNLYTIGNISGIPEDVDCDRIIEGLDTCSKENVIKIERVYRRDDNSRATVASDRLKIFFKDSLPTSVLIYKIFFKVYLFTPVILRCYRCHQFGHGTQTCSNQELCVNCGLNHSNISQCSNPPRCVNCKSDHKSSNKTCIFFEFFKEVNIYASLLRISKNEATVIVQELYKNRYQFIGP